jgi:UDPglucose 6-dehydrogenase
MVASISRSIRLLAMAGEHMAVERATARRYALAQHGEPIIVRLGIVGLGVVGSAILHGFERIGHDVLGYDIRDPPPASIEDLIDTDAVFICVPTPQGQDGSCDASRVEGVVAKLADLEYRGLAVIKSTVQPGTTDRIAATHGSLRIAFCPEFLRERAALVDFVEHHDVCVIGAFPPSSNRRPEWSARLGCDDVAVLRDAHGTMPAHVAVMTPTEAELAKYFSNVFNALRVVFANEFYEVCRAMGASYGTIKDAMIRRSTIVDAYLDCNERYRGFGGVCLPKDTQAFAAHVRSLGLDMKLFETIVQENKKFRITIPDGMREA